MITLKTLSLTLCRRWTFRIVLAGIMALCLGYLPYRAYGPKGIGRLVRLEQRLDSILHQNIQLVLENENLRKLVRQLKNDRTVLERVARDELGLVRPDDLVFQFE